MERLNKSAKGSVRSLYLDGKLGANDDLGVDFASQFTSEPRKSRSLVSQFRFLGGGRDAIGHFGDENQVFDHLLRELIVQQARLELTHRLRGQRVQPAVDVLGAHKISPSHFFDRLFSGHARGHVTSHVPTEQNADEPGAQRSNPHVRMQQVVDDMRPHFIGDFDAVDVAQSIGAVLRYLRDGVKRLNEQQVEVSILFFVVDRLE